MELGISIIGIRICDMKTLDIGITIPALDKLEIIQHAFTTRWNGLGARTKGLKQVDDWKVVADAFGVPLDRVITVNQVHGEAIMTVDEQNYRKARSTEADALITRARGIAIGVETADCTPAGAAL